ncbi:endonuclease/exonuclease/phosphatase family protein [Sulfitobacter sp. S190]|uniref:endonuclease/exonuclease/phosphatase family protein n=1 Tax=Sulfitobacter sp. S190 TaxID=2867022 RepID=UPI0021A3C728|nr:endonuclease/exonuclease/phosphatase family protein [Sulfitobacter sp. S190]
MWDFPRLHIAAVAFVVLLLAISPISIPFKSVLITIVSAALGYQVVHIFPYTKWSPTEVSLTEAPSVAHEVSLLSVNVLMENERHDDLLKLLEREDPDVLLLMETDAIWADALEPYLARYGTVRTHITDDHYGLIFATRLKALSAELVWLSRDDTPAIKALLCAPNNTKFNFIGLHPRPPVPGNDTKTRDEQIREAALMTSSAERPTVCMGDFNDVAWSSTTKRFKHYADFREPRVGRGMLSSFHAGYPWMRLPIDQLFVTQDIGLTSFARLENFGSDHFPIHATVFFPTRCVLSRA